MNTRAVRRSVVEVSRRLGVEEELRVAHAWLGARAERRDRLDNAGLLRLSQRLPRDANVVDAAASHGAILTWIVGYAPDGRHTAFEPAPHLANELRQRFPSVRVVEAAVADVAGSAPFWRARVDTR